MYTYVEIFGHQFACNFFLLIFCGVIDNFVQYGALDDRRHQLSGPFISVATKENIETFEIYFKKNRNAAIRKVSRVL